MQAILKIVNTLTWSYCAIKFNLGFRLDDGFDKPTSRSSAEGTQGQSAFVILVTQLWLSTNRASINESLNTVHSVAPASLDSITVIVTRRERLHSFHEMRIQF